MNNSVCFEDAQAQHRLTPESFGVPSERAILTLTAGGIVKVCVGGERFWTKVVHVNHDTGAVAAVVDNELVCSDVHGLEYGDTVVFERRHIYEIDGDEVQLGVDVLQELNEKMVLAHNTIEAEECCRKRFQRLNTMRDMLSSSVDALDMQLGAMAGKGRVESGRPPYQQH